jgi:hypothetical protein
MANKPYTQLQGGPGGTDSINLPSTVHSNYGQTRIDEARIEM